MSDCPSAKGGANPNAITEAMRRAAAKLDRDIDTEIKRRKELKSFPWLSPDVFDEHGYIRNGETR